MTYPDTPGHKGSVETGRDAARYFALQLPRRQRQVLDGLSEGPASAEELSERIGLHWYLVRPRLSELKVKGLVADNGDRAVGALGGKVQRLRLTTAQERSDFAARQALEDRE